MTSEIRTNTLTSRAGLSTVTLTDSGPMFSGITTFVDNSTFSVGTGGTIHAPATNVMALGTNNIDAIKIDSSGNVNISGILTASSISGGVSLTNGSNNRVVTATGAAALTGESGLTFDGSTLNLTSASGDARVTVIGTEGNDARLSLVSDDGDDHIDQYNLRVAASDNRFYIDQFESGAFQERFTIANGGNIGIGTDNPAKKLEVFDTTQGVIRIRGGAGGSNSSRKADLSLFASGAREYVVRADASDAAFKIVDVSGSNSERLRIDTSGNATFNTGNIIIGTAGKGIDYSAQTPTAVSGATATGEVFDHYEEGTWTATLGNVNAPTYEAQGGVYTRIGRMVFCDCTIGVASGLDTSDGSGFQIRGLPFTGSTTGGTVCLFSLGRYTNLLGGKATSVRNVRFLGDGVLLQEGNDSDIAYNECSSSGYLQISFAYMMA